MELEQRVKALEYEVKILKNEIQKTLLAIQEQILIHYHPSLRAGEDAPLEGVAQSLESIRERRTTDGTQQTGAAPVKKVSLEELTPAMASGTGNSETNAQTGQQEAVRLSKWVGQGVGKIGKERMARLIPTCVDNGWISLDSREVLLRFAALSDETKAPETVTINEVLGVIMDLNPQIEPEIDLDKALSLIEEADLG